MLKRIYSHMSISLIILSILLSNGCVGKQPEAIIDKTEKETQKAISKQVTKETTEKVVRDLPLIITSEAYEVAEKMMLKNPTNYLPLIELAYIYSKFGKYKGAFEIAEKMESETDKAYTLSNIAMAYAENGKINESLKVINQSIGTIENIKDESSKNTFLTNTALSCVKTGQMIKSSEIINKAVEIAKKIDDEKYEEKPYLLSDIAIDCVKADQYEQAIETMKEIKKLKDDEKKFLALNRILNRCVEIDKKNEVLEFFNQALEIAKDIKNEYFEVEALINIANTYIEAGKKDKALDILNRALEVVEKIEDKDSTHKDFTLKKITIIYAEIGEYEKALKVVKKIEDETDKFEILMIITNIYTEVVQ